MWCFIVRLFCFILRRAEESLKAKHTQLPTDASDCQLDPSEPNNRNGNGSNCGTASPMINNCTTVGTNARHHHLISDQEPPDGDETDPDVIPNQYGM